MARIAAAELERLKASVPVAELVASDGVALSRQGADLSGLCPFHDDREPSLKVTPGKNLWHCFGCGAGGGPVDWVMRRRGVSFRHAVELLRERTGVAPDSPAETAASSLAAVAPAAPARLASPVSLDEDDAAALGRVVDYYHACLKRRPAALAYLAKRGIADPAAIDTFRLGFSDRTLGLRLPDKRKREGAELRSRLERVGLYRASGHEHFCGSLVVPVLDEAGAVAEVYGRKITEGLRAGTPLHLYLPGPHRGVWNLPGIAGAPDGEVILCEALIDALTFWCAGYRNVTASYGADGFTDAHLAAFQAHGVRRVLIAYDRDAAGDRGAAEVAERLAAAGIASGRVEFPHGLDANAYALKVTPAAKSLGVLLRRAGAGCATVSDPAPETVSGASEAAAKEEGPVAASDDSPASPLAAALPAAPPEEGPPPAGRPSAGIPPADAGGILASSAPTAPDQPAPPSASATQSRPPPEIEASGGEATLRFGERRWRVRGLDRASGGETLKLNLMAAAGEDGASPGAFHVDTLDSPLTPSYEAFAHLREWCWRTSPWRTVFAVAFSSEVNCSTASKMSLRSSSWGPRSCGSNTSASALTDSAIASRRTTSSVGWPVPAS